MTSPSYNQTMINQACHSISTNGYNIEGVGQLNSWITMPSIVVRDNGYLEDVLRPFKRLKTEPILKTDLSVDIRKDQRKNEFNQYIEKKAEEVAKPKFSSENGEKHATPTSNVVSNEFNQSVENKAKVVKSKFSSENRGRHVAPTSDVASLVENFSYDQIKEHIKSLRQGFGQNTLDEEIGVDGKSCTLCKMKKLHYEPDVIHCSSCQTCIKRDTNFYYKRGEKIDEEKLLCSSCFKKSKGESININGVSILKEMFNQKNNNHLNEESWVECDKCKTWQHQMCSLFNNEQNLEGNVQYVCPMCCIKDIEEGIRTPSGTDYFGAKDLPRTKLSDHLEQRLFSSIENERENKAKVEGKNVDEISWAENLTIREVLSVKKQLEVKKEFLDILPADNYPLEFPYTSKVILLFQNIEGADVCIFVLFIQEFGSECSHPNHRSVYISYIDSVKYFRPHRGETATGEALRTFVYHEILIGYLEFCKKRGFEKCYIWSCPPTKGDDYVLYCHPKSQRIPNNAKLRQWYLALLRRASKEHIVVGLTNIYDKFFVASKGLDSFVTAAQLPYFDGDYWSGAAMNEIKRIENDVEGKCGRNSKLELSKRALKSMGYIDTSNVNIKDALVMHALGKTISPFKEDFIIVQLQHECTICHHVIMSGKRWSCNECKNYQQCERCHTSDSHTSTSGEKHTLYQAVVGDIPSDTKENDDIAIDNELFKNRVDFLNFCREKHFHFDTLRHAKHSTMMIIHHLIKANLQRVTSTANCPSKNQREGHNRTQMKMQILLKILKHTSRCPSTKNQPCSVKFCSGMKKLFSHATRCEVRLRGGCQHCRKAWTLMAYHSMQCNDSECLVPRCEHLKPWLAQQQEFRRQVAIEASNLF